MTQIARIDEEEKSRYRFDFVTMGRDGDSATLCSNSGFPDTEIQTEECVRVTREEGVEDKEALRKILENFVEKRMLPYFDGHFLKGTKKSWYVTAGVNSFVSGERGEVYDKFKRDLDNWIGKLRPGNPAYAYQTPLWDAFKAMRATMSTAVFEESASRMDTKTVGQASGRYETFEDIIYTNPELGYSFRTASHEFAHRLVDREFSRLTFGVKVIPGPPRHESMTISLPYPLDNPTEYIVSGKLTSGTYTGASTKEESKLVTCHSEVYAHMIAVLYTFAAVGIKQDQIDRTQSDEPTIAKKAMADILDQCATFEDRAHRWAIAGYLGFRIDEQGNPVARDINLHEAVLGQSIYSGLKHNDSYQSPSILHFNVRAIPFAPLVGSEQWKPINGVSAIEVSLATSLSGGSAITIGPALGAEYDWFNQTLSVAPGLIVQIGSDPYDRAGIGGGVVLKVGTNIELLKHQGKDIMAVGQIVPYLISNASGLGVGLLIEGSAGNMWRLGDPSVPFQNAFDRKRLIIAPTLFLSL